MIDAAIDQAVTELTSIVGVKAACAAVGATPRQPLPPPPPAPAPPAAPTKPRKPQPGALTPTERQEVLHLLHAERFVDLAPAEVHAILLDEGRCLCSESTMYRLLPQAHVHVTDRRHRAVHPARVNPSWSRPARTKAGPGTSRQHDPTRLTGSAAHHWHGRTSA